MPTWRITMQFDIDAEDESMALGMAGDLAFDCAETLGWRDALIAGVEPTRPTMAA